MPSVSTEIAITAGAGLVSHDVHVGTANNMHFGAQSVPDISCSGSQPASAEKVMLCMHIALLLHLAISHRKCTSNRHITLAFNELQAGMASLMHACHRSITIRNTYCTICAF